MSTYTNNKPAVRDSFDDDDVSDDVDDEVFIKDGRNGFKMDEEMGVKRPLMAPRRKAKSALGSQFHSEVCKQPQCRMLCVPCCYSILALVALFGFVSLVVVVINMFPFPLNKIRIWSDNIGSLEKLILPSIELKTHESWVKTFPKLTSEAALTLNDVNKDNVQDVIVGFGTGADSADLGEVICASYMPGVSPCMGGVMALDGRTGETLWQHWTHRSVILIDCSTDITNDQINDCIVSGQGGVLCAINGHDGSLIWQLKKPPNKENVDVYAAQFISDVNFDFVPDIITAHSSIQGGQGQGHLLVLSGRTSSVITQVPTPNYESIYSHPLTLVRPDGTTIVLFNTGSVNSLGGLYAVPLHLLVSGNISESLQLIKGGVNDSPILIDINKDGTEDIVAISEDKVIAINGLTFEQFWSATSSSSIFGPLQLLNSPTPAYFNDDDIPDFLFTHVAGKNYPEYYFSQASVIDGSSGLPLLDKPMVSSAFVNVAGIALGMVGKGNDFFLYWVGVCVGHEETQERFSFLNSTPIRHRAKADLCKLRFNTTLNLRLYALSQHVAPPGLLLYSTEATQRDNLTAIQNSGPSHPPALEQPNPVPASNFYHKGDSVEHLKSSHHAHHTTQYGSRELPINVEEYERMSFRHPQVEWHPQEPTYGNLLLQNRRYPSQSMYGSNSLPEGLPLPDLESGYGHEGDEGRLFPPNTLGRDERDDRQRRSAPSIQLLPHIGSPGLLVPSVDENTVDLIFTTHWQPGSDLVKVRLPQEEQCIQQRMANIPSEHYEDLETLRATVEEECFLQHGTLTAIPNTYQPSVPSGQLTVRRLSFTYSCDMGSAAQEECSHPLAFWQQSWPRRGANLYYKPCSFLSQPVLA